MILGNDILSWIGAQPTYKRYTLPTGRAIDVTPLGVIVHPIPNLMILENPTSMTLDAHWDDLENIFSVDVQYATILMLDGLEPENEMERLTHEVAQMRCLENIGIENVSVTDELKKSTRDLITLFNESVRFNSKGELEVAFPFNGNESRLADNRAVALRRLQSLLSSFKGDQLREYNKIFVDQRSARYIEEATPQMLAAHAPVYYIPHRAVFKEDSLTTKVRVVLDASSHARGQLSLNDCLHAGTNMIVPIYGILLRARCTKYVIIADIAKAFHQVRLQEEFRNSTCFLWLKDLTKSVTPDNIVVYRSTVIPFGVASSPFLLAAYITYHLDNNPDDINEEIKRNLYVDNALFGTNDRNSIVPIITKTKTTFANMGMNLRDYFVNDEEVMNEMDSSIVTSVDTLKVLGYAWDRKRDTWTGKIAILDIDHPTKREVASKLAETFDPLGLFTPLMVEFKRLLQQLWSHDMNWKDPIPVELLPKWRRLQESFKHDTLVVPRQLTLNYEYDHVELLIFADASQDVYACLAYACFIREGETPDVQLLTSKNKIKPSKHEKWTIPKLELLALECGSTLASNVIAELRIKVNSIRLFTDSACALFWILSHQNKRIWVANRIKKIQGNQARMLECGIETTIHHCPTTQNPADLATRGLTTVDLQNNLFWFTGPDFLRQPPSEWPCKIEGKVTCPTEFQDLVYAEMDTSKPSTRKKPLMQKATKPIPSQSELVMIANMQDGSTGSIVPFSRTNSLGKLTRIVSLVLKTFTSALKNKDWQTYVFKEYALAQCEGQQQAVARCLIIQEHYKDSQFQKLTFPPPSQYTVSEVDGLYRVRKHVHSPVLPAEAAEPIVIIAKHKLAEMLIYETHVKGDHMLESYVRSGFCCRIAAEMLLFDN